MDVAIAMCGLEVNSKISRAYAPTWWNVIMSQQLWVGVILS